MGSDTEVERNVFQVVVKQFTHYIETIAQDFEALIKTHQ